MKLKIVLLLVTFCFVSIFSEAQSDLNGYKYILVPNKFDFQKKENQYKLSSLTKFLFNKEGFVTLIEGEEVPQDLYDNPCLALKVKMISKSNLFSTKVFIGLVNCRDKEVFMSSEGKSKVKEFKKAYHQATRDAFESVKSINYAYNGNASIQFKANIEKDSPIVEEVIEEAVSIPEAPINEIPEQPVKEVIDVKDTVEEDVTSEMKKDVTIVEDVVSNNDVLYAQSKSFGFQLVDSTPKVIYVLQKTSLKDLFILKNKGGILHKKNGKWIAEYYENDTLLKKELAIKF